jgi:uncharacterized protein
MIEYLRARAATFCITAAVAWLALLSLEGWACTLAGWGPLDAVRPVTCRVSGAVTVPFASLAAAVIPGSAHHYGRLHTVLRTAIATATIVGGLALLLAARHRRAARGRREGEEAEPAKKTTRRQVLARLSDAAVIGAAAALGGWAVIVEPARLRLVRYEIPIANLPRPLDGFRIVQLSDTHYGPYNGVRHIAAAVELANAQRPDLVALTGDYVHRGVQMIAPGIRPFARLRSRLGAVSVLGNHDHWEDPEACQTALRRAGVRPLDNSRLFATATSDELLEEEVPGESCAICGVGDLWEDLCSPRSALRGVSPRCPRILLCHNPDGAEDLARTSPESRFDLQLSGHTHGGQIDLPFLGTPAVPSHYGTKYTGGYVEGPRWPVIVSRGVGVSVAPVRFGVVPEVVLVVLRRA